MKANDDLKSVLWNRLSRFNIDDNKKNQLIAELDVLSNLIIDSYLEYNKEKIKTKGENGKCSDLL